MSRGGRTATAVVAVVLMLGGAVLVRDRLSDDGGTESPADRPTLLCAQELGAVCEAIAQHEAVKVVTQPAAITAKTLEGTTDLADVHADGWLTIAPQTGIVNDAQTREQREPVFGADETVARSPLVFVVTKERKAQLANRCPAAQIGWTCVADVTDHKWSDLGGEGSWGNVEVGHADPARDTVGLLAIGQQAASKLGHSNFSYADVHDEGFSSWLLDVKGHEQRDAGEGPLAPMLRLGTGTDVAQVTEAEACSRLGDAAQAGKFGVVVPTPVSTADVVFAPVRGRAKRDGARAAALSETARAALGRAGWREGDGAGRGAACAAVGPVSVEPSNHVPEAGGLTALRDLWEGSG